MSKRSWLAGLLACAAAWTAYAEEDEELAVGNEAVLTLAYPVRRAESKIEVDGKLRPEEWGRAVRVGGFRLSGSEKLAPEQTVMQLLYDDRNLYMGFKCAESQMDKLVIESKIDDGDLWRDDCVEFFVDANHNHATYWHFIVNAIGARYDGVGFDRTWSCEWTAKTSQAPNAWYVELAVPFASLKVAAPAPGTVWGFNLDRERRAGGGTQLYNWADVQGNFHRPTLFGHLWFAAPGWRPEELPPPEALERIEGKEAHVYIPGGYWLVREGRQPKAWSYRELLQQQSEAVADYWDKLQEIYSRHPKMVFRDQFEKFGARYADVKRLAAQTGPVDPEACASAKVFLDGLEEKLNVLYWKVRIELLNRTF